MELSSKKSSLRRTKKEQVKINHKFSPPLSHETPAPGDPPPVVAGGTGPSPPIPLPRLGPPALALGGGGPDPDDEFAAPDKKSNQLCAPEELGPSVVDDDADGFETTQETS